MSSLGRAVITGLGVVAPTGTGTDLFWRALLEARSAIGPVTQFDASDFPCRIAGEVRDFEPERFIPEKLRPRVRMARATQFAVAAAKLALADAGIDPAAGAGCGPVPVIMGVSTTAMDLRARPARPWSALHGIPHAVGSAVASILGLEARLLTVSNGCGSGLDAVAVAAGEVLRERYDVVLAGGADSSIDPYTFECFAKGRKLSCRNDEPGKASRPFDRDRDGGIVSEGAAVFVVENREHALGRAATPYAEISGYGSCADNWSEDEGSGLALAMRLALASVPWRAAEVDYVSAHGPSDRHMDVVETRAIREVFGKRAYRIPITSIKGVIGNPMGVGGAHQIAAAVLSFRHGIIPPTANLEHPGPECDLDYVQGPARPARPRRILVNTHGFGRTNSAMALSPPTPG